MPFRADESAAVNNERALRKLTEHLPERLRAKAKVKVEELVARWGPVVEGYPSWHPLVANQPKPQSSPKTRPQDGCGYVGLDHTVLLRNAFITCPYSNGKDVIESVDKLPEHKVCSVTAEPIKVKLYHEKASAVLVKCEWHDSLLPDGTIPLRTAAGLLLETELPEWEHAQVGESWDTMRIFFLGDPHGQRSSLFVNEKTGQGLKKLWATLNAVGLFGPVRG